MTFFYNNNERLRFIFDTPNQFGVFLNFILFFILALTIVLFCHGKKKNRGCRFVTRGNPNNCITGYDIFQRRNRRNDYRCVIHEHRVETRY